MNQPNQAEPPPTPSMQQLQEQRDLYLREAQTELELRIIKVGFDSLAIGLAQGDDETAVRVHNDLVDLVGTWRRYYLSVKNQVITKDQLRLEVEFMEKYFPLLTLGDVEWMIELSIHRRLILTYPYTIVFNVDWITRIVHAYKAFKIKHGARLYQAVNDREAHMASTPAQKADWMRWQIEQVKNAIQRGSLIVHFLQEVYAYLHRTHRLISPGPAQQEEAGSYAARRIIAFEHSVHSLGSSPTTRDIMRGGKKVDGAQRDELQERYMCEYQLSEYFKHNDLADILAGVHDKHFKE